ncbi:mitochondrial carrier [Yamadazyma tenuis ATCC 10573]|nr:mitochondrial carrier [Yamadazyma tenuis ATCC 10573]EGV61140.1 mitochondrial carrier [Yamadazyma tenuis ATCC 10573]
MSGFIETICIIPFENIKITMIQNMSLYNEITKVKEIGSNVDVTGYSIPGKHHKPPQNIFNKQYISPHAYFTSEVLASFRGVNPSKFSSTHLVKHTKMDALKHKYNKNPSLTFWGTVREIYSIKGPKGFMYGSLITIVRQTMISSIWLSSYNTTKQVFLPHHKSGEGWFSEQYTLYQYLGLQLVAAAVVIVTTQPIDVVKSYMQSKNSHTAYKDSLSTAYKIVLEHGFSGLYKGYFPRGIKVAVAGSISASFYAYFEQLISTASSKTVFSND